MNLTGVIENELSQVNIKLGHQIADMNEDDAREHLENQFTAIYEAIGETSPETRDMNDVLGKENAKEHFEGNQPK